MSKHKGFACLVDHPLFGSRRAEPTDEEHRAAWLERVYARMDRVDQMPPDVRAVVHDWGLTIVDSFMGSGVKSARHMRHIINTVLNETRGQFVTEKGFAQGSKQYGGEYKRHKSHQDTPA